MIAVENRVAADLVAGLMGERVFRKAHAKCAQQAVMSDAPKTDEGTQVRQGCDPGLQEGAAIVDFGPDGFVLRRNAAHGIGDHRAGQFQPVIRAGIKLAIGKVEFA